MQQIPAKNVVGIINRTLNLVDARLIDHGGRVADFVHQALCRKGGYGLRQRRDICLLALLHDIGAYKTEEIDRMVYFETVDIWAHSIYGYLFAKYISPLSELAPALFFHHASLSDLEHLHPSYHDIAQMLHIADRMDILSQASGKLERQNFLRHFNRRRGVKYRSDLVDLFDDALFASDAERVPFDSLFADMSFSRNQLNAYLTMMVLSIDFRSPQTVTHTMTATTISRVLAELVGLGREAAGDVHLGTMLHDLGKQGIPPEILESTERLSPKAMEVMRGHVRLTEDILAGQVDEAVVNIAARHHERLDGSGYPRGLTAAELDIGERLVAVADIMSALLGVRSYKDAYPVEKVLRIIGEVRDQGKIDADVVAAATRNFPHILVEVEKTSESTMNMYGHLNQEFERFRKLTGSLRNKGSDWVLEEALSWGGTDRIEREE